MRISIRIKFSIFLAALLLMTVLILSLLVLQGIRQDQQKQYEQYLAQQARTANIYFLQSILSEQNKDPQNYLADKGSEFTGQLELISGQSIVLYDSTGTVASGNASVSNQNDLATALGYALLNKTAYQVEDDSLYYLAPLKVGSEQAGVVQFYYSLSESHAFYNNIRRLFLYIGGSVFIAGFLLSYLYFNSFAGKIIRLGRMVDGIRGGRYRTEIIHSRDEIGSLSEGIHAMSTRIMHTIGDLEDEKNKLILAVEKLSRLEKQQKQFIGNVTHEFKTPLTSIKAYLDLLSLYPDDDKLLETARKNIGNEADRLYEMVDKVLQLSALEKYDFELHKERMDTGQAIRQVLQSLQGRINKFGLRLQADLSESCVEADRDSMTIILVNLLDNAIKYNKPNGSIAVRNNQENGRVIIEIADTGIGIPPELAEKIFEHFYTVDKNRSRRSGGAGLGLSLVRQHVELQGGTIALVKTGPEGSTFRVSFPTCSKS